MGYGGGGGGGGGSGGGGGGGGAAGGGGGYTTVGGGSAFGDSSGQELPSYNQAPAGSIRFNTDSKKLEVYILGPVGFGTTPNGIWMEVDSWSPDLMTGGTRVISLGGYYTPVGYIDDMYYINAESTGNSLTFGELTLGVNHVNSGNSDRTRGFSAGGSNSAGRGDNIEFITMASTGNSTDFGADLTVARYGIAPGSNGTRGLFAGGNHTPSGTQSDTIDYITMQSTGVAAQDFGNLTIGRKYPAGSFCSSTRQIIAGGQTPSNVSDMNFIIMSTLGNAADFGDLTSNRNQNCGGISSNSIRGITMSGSDGTSVTNHIEYVTISTLGNSKDFGDISSAGSNGALSASSTRAVRLGNSSPSYLNTISYVQIMSTGDAVDFGDLSVPVAYNGSCSNGHGGL